MHALAGPAFTESFALLGPASKAIVLVLLGVLLVLGCRHLLLLGLAMYEHFTRTLARDVAPGARLPFISIIVPAYNEGPMIAQVLESLQRVRYPRFEVVVVDDGSSDQTFLRALPFRRQRGAEYRVLTKSNGGKFDALNHGIARARGEIVVCIDGDSLLHPDALLHCAAHFEDPRIGAVAGKVRVRSEEHTSELQSRLHLVCRLLLEKKKKK